LILARPAELLFEEVQTASNIQHLEFAGLQEVEGNAEAVEVEDQVEGGPSCCSSPEVVAAFYVDLMHIADSW
jgi:hypothetical protein